MANWEQLVQSAYIGLLGKIPQVYADFVHYYGEDKVDLVVIPNLSNTVHKYTFDVTGYSSLVQTINMQDLIAHSSTGINMFHLAKFKELLNGQEMLTIENILPNLEEAEVNTILLVTNTFILRNYYSLGARIIIHFPERTLVNDYDKRHYMKDLYVKLEVKRDGTIYDSIMMTKSTFSNVEWTSRYVHSHSSGATLTATNDSIWGSCCLGRGPLSSTIPALRVDSNLEMWPLFCLELDRYTEVESLQGGPYQKFEHLNSRSFSQVMTNLSGAHTFFASPAYKQFILDNPSFLKKFLIYIVQKKTINFNYYHNKFNIGHSFTDYVLILSNLFIEYYNREYVLHTTPENRITLETLYRIGILGEGIIENNLIKYTSTSREITRESTGQIMFNFKGRPVIHRVEQSVTQSEVLILLTPSLLDSITNILLTFINNGTELRNIKEASRYVGQAVLSI